MFPYDYDKIAVAMAIVSGGLFILISLMLAIGYVLYG